MGVDTVHLWSLTITLHREGMGPDSLDCSYFLNGTEGFATVNSPFYKIAGNENIESATVLRVLSRWFFFSSGFRGSNNRLSDYIAYGL